MSTYAHGVTPSAWTLLAEPGATEFSWTWRLHDADGAVHAAHRAALDPDALPAYLFTDLYTGLRWNAANFAEATEMVGLWAATHALGRDITLALLEAAPAVIAVELPPDARFLAGYPWELVRAGGRTLAEHGIAFEYRPVGAPPARAQAAPEQMRILAVLSQPSDGAPVSLRAVRNRLRELADRNPQAMTLRLVEFDATRQRLRRELADPLGWDVVHVSGHGEPGTLILEHDDGTGDPCPADVFADLLAAAASPPRLVVVTACESAAASAAALFDPGSAAPASVDAGLAWRVRDETGAAVVAMRYPASAELVDVFVPAFYDGLIARAEPVAEAYRAALATVAIAARTPRPYTPSSLPGATAVLFGPTPAGPLAAAVPAADPDPSDEAERFVGRVPELRAALAALTGPQPRPVHLHGMPGVGATALARELARRLAETGVAATWHDGRTPPAEGTLLIVDGVDADQQLTDLPPRTVITGRFAPPAGHALAIPLTPLGPDETLHLVWDSVPLRELSRRVRAGEIAPDLATDEQATALLIATEGHPGMFGQLEQLAADPAGFAAAAAAAHRSAADGEPPWLFPAATQIAEWARQVRQSLPEPARLLADVLAVGQVGDHCRMLLELVWPRIYRQWHDEDPPDTVAVLLERLHAAGLLGTAPYALTAPPEADLHLHRAVASALTAGMDPELRQVIHWAYAASWFDLLRPMTAGPADPTVGEVATRISRAALAAAHHCVPLGEWQQALGAIWVALRHRPLPDTAADADRVLRSGQPQDERLEAAWAIAWAGARARFDPVASAQSLHRIREATAANGWVPEHIQATDRLLDLVKDQAGPLREQLTDELVQYAVSDHDRLYARLRRADLWQRTGATDRAWAEAQALVSAADQYPAPWQLREPALAILAAIAFGRGEPEQALRLQQQIDDSQRDRGAAEVERAGLWLRMAWGAMLAGRGDDARELIERGQAAHRWQQPGGADRVTLLLTRAFVELHAGDAWEAVELATQALRAGYQPPSPGILATCHLVFARAVVRLLSERAEPVIDADGVPLPLRHAAAHARAAAFLTRATDPGSALEADALGFGAGLPAPPAAFDDLAAIVDSLTDTAFGELGARLVADGAARDDILRQLDERHP